jgi:ribonucleoside-triphosphate reductase
VFHAFLGEKLPDWKAAAELVRKIAENYKLPYYTMSPTYSVCGNHGYLTGEQPVCPKCGQHTEVWSRITGYYRPVQNWNDGKVQEFKDRKVYNIGASNFTGGIHRADVCPCGDDTVGGIQPEDMDAAGEAKAQLFTRVTCPNCRVAERLLDKEGFVYENLTAEEHPELCRQFGVKGAPTLVISDGVHFESYYGVAEIKKYLQSVRPEQVG